jgi:hypothetical protein
MKKIFPSNTLIEGREEGCGGGLWGLGGVEGVLFDIHLGVFFSGAVH